MDNNYISFRKAKVGGFNKKDVINYIEKMLNDFYDYKKAVEATVENLNAKINELEVLNNGIKSVTDAQEVKDTVCEINDCDPIADINASAVRLRMVADELCRNLTDFMGTVITESAEKDCSECETEESEADSKEVEVKIDRAEQILACSANFSFFTDDAKKTEYQSAFDSERKSVLDSLSSSAFFN